MDAFDGGVSVRESGVEGEVVLPVQDGSVAVLFFDPIGSSGSAQPVTDNDRRWTGRGNKSGTRRQPRGRR